PGALPVGPHEKVLRYSQHGKESSPFRDKRESRLDYLWRTLPSELDASSVVIQSDAPEVGFQDACEALQESALAVPVRSEQNGDASFLDIHGDAMEHPDPAVARLEILDGEDALATRQCRLSRPPDSWRPHQGFLRRSSHQNRGRLPSERRSSPLS